MGRNKFSLFTYNVFGYFPLILIFADIPQICATSYSIFLMQEFNHIMVCCWRINVCCKKFKICIISWSVWKKDVSTRLMILIWMQLWYSYLWVGVFYSTQIWYLEVCMLGKQSIHVHVRKIIVLDFL